MTKNYYIHGNTVRELEAPARQNRRTRAVDTWLSYPYVLQSLRYLQLHL